MAKKIEFETSVTRRFETTPQSNFTLKTSNTGKITVNVYTYFVKAGLPDIKKIFNLAAEHCTAKQRKQLIKDLNTVKDFWNKEYNYIQYLKQNYSIITFQISRAFVDFYPSAAKKSEKLQAKLDKVIALLKNSQWSDEIKKSIEEVVNKDSVSLRQMSCEIGRRLYEVSIIDEYAVSPAAMEVAIEAEEEQAAATAVEDTAISELVTVIADAGYTVPESIINGTDKQATLEHLAIIAEAAGLIEPVEIYQ